MSLYGVANSRSSSSSFSTGLNDSVSCTLVTVKEWLMLMGPQLCKQDFSIIQSFNCNRKYLSPFVPLVELPFVILPCLVLPKPKPFLGSFTLDAVATLDSCVTIEKKLDQFLSLHWQSPLQNPHECEWAFRLFFIRYLEIVIIVFSNSKGNNNP